MQLVYETGTLDSSSRLTLAIQGCREKQSTNKLRAETAYKEKTMNLNKTHFRSAQQDVHVAIC
jgi:hypothetical protein